MTGAREAPAQVAAGLIGVAAVCVAAYACSLYRRSLQLRRQEVYIQGFVQTLGVVLRAREARVMRRAQK